MSFVNLTVNTDYFPVQQLRFGLSNCNTLSSLWVSFFVYGFAAHRGPWPSHSWGL